MTDLGQQTGPEYHQINQVTVDFRAERGLIEPTLLNTVRARVCTCCSSKQARQLLTPQVMDSVCVGLTKTSDLLYCPALSCVVCPYSGQLSLCTGELHSCTSAKTRDGCSSIHPKKLPTRVKLATSLFLWSSKLRFRRFCCWTDKRPTCRGFCTRQFSG